MILAWIVRIWGSGCKKNKKEKKKQERKDIFQKRKRIKGEEEKKRKRNVWAVICHLPFREDVIMGSPENDRSTVFAWTSMYENERKINR